MQAEKGLPRLCDLDCPRFTQPWLKREVLCSSHLIHSHSCSETLFLSFRNNVLFLCLYINVIQHRNLILFLLLLSQRLPDLFQEQLFINFFALSMLNRKSKLISTYRPPVMVGENLSGTLRWKDLFLKIFFKPKSKLGREECCDWLVMSVLGAGGKTWGVSAICASFLERWALSNACCMKGVCILL